MESSKSYCPLCGAKQYHRAIKRLKLTYKGHSLTVQQPGFWCDACGEGVVEGKDIKATREKLQSFRARIDGILTPGEILKIRKKILRLTQKQANEICGGGPNAFSRYERGEVPPPKAVSNLLRILKYHPEDLKQIQPKRKNDGSDKITAAH